MVFRKAGLGLVLVSFLAAAAGSQAAGILRGGQAAAAPPAAAASNPGAAYPVSYLSVYGIHRCYADAEVRPATTQQLASALVSLRAGAAAAGHALKVRVSRSRFHGTATLNCPGAFGPGPGSPVKFTVPVPGYGPPHGAPVTSSAAPRTAVVLIEDFAAVTRVDRATNRVTVQSGLRIDKLLQWAEANGFSMERGAPSTYAELTIGGVLVTGGHGTGFNITSNLADAVVSFTWIDGNGTVHVSTRDSPEGRALSGGFGLIGIISEVTLQMTPPSMTAAYSRVFLNDANLMDDIKDVLKVSPWAAIIWRPDIYKYSAFNMVPTTKQSNGGAITLVPRTPRILTAMVELFNYPWQGDYRDQMLAKLMNPLNCLVQAVTVIVQTWGSIGIIPTPVAVGSTNKIAGGGCEPECAWDNDMAVDDIAFAIEYDDLPAWIEDVRRITKLDLQDGGAAPERCMTSGHYLIRWGRGSNDYAAPWGGLRLPVQVELSVLRNRQLPDIHAKYSWIQDAVEQLTLCRYKGRTHHGKNFDRTFMHPRCPLRDNLFNFQALLDLRSKYDPDKVFEPPLMAAMIKREAAPLFPRCALTKQCYCEADVHCGPGHKCVRSTAFPEYKACRPDSLGSLFG